MLSEILEGFLRWLRECCIQYNIDTDRLKECEAEQQDILHKLELEQLDYHTLAKLGKELKEVRRQRRLCKESMERLYLVVAYMDEHSRNIKQMEQLLGDMRKVESRQLTRQYGYKSEKYGG